jgi:hypothetical protein
MTKTRWGVCTHLEEMKQKGKDLYMQHISERRNKFLVTFQVTLGRVLGNWETQIKTEGTLFPYTFVDFGF